MFTPLYNWFCSLEPTLANSNVVFSCWKDSPHPNRMLCSTVEHKPIERQTEDLEIYFGLIAADSRFFPALDPWLDSRWYDVTCLSVLFYWYLRIRAASVWCGNKTNNIKQKLRTSCREKYLHFLMSNVDVDQTKSQPERSFHPSNASRSNFEQNI